MNLRTSVSAIVLAAVMLCAATTVHANPVKGYVCQVEQFPAKDGSGYGDAGYVFVVLYNGPGCTSGFLLSGFLCTKGATQVSACDLSPGGGYDSVSLSSVAQNLARAADTGQRISARYSLVNGWKILLSFAFWGD